MAAKLVLSSNFVGSRLFASSKKVAIRTLQTPKHSFNFNRAINAVQKSVSPLNINRKITVIPMTEQEALEKKQKANLPVSPHVTIYKFPLPAITSITHRFTGI